MKRLALLVSLMPAMLLAAAPSPTMQALETKAKAGDADAEFRLAEAYRTGQGVTGNLDTAIGWFRKAADQGDVRASEELGFTLFANNARREAMPYIEKAAARGEPRAFYLLGTAHFNGDYATRDWPLAYAQTTRAASAGLSAAIHNLALMDKYMLPADRAKAEEILATLPPVRKSAPEQPLAVAAATVSDTDATAAANPKPGSKAKSDAKAKATKTDAKAIELASASSTAGKAKKPADDGANADAAKPTTRAKKAALADDDAAPAEAAATGKWKVQLGAFGSADRIDQRWKAMTAKYPRVRTLEKRVMPGKAQRLVGVGLASKADAEALCQQIKTGGGDCLVLAP